MFKKFVKWCIRRLIWDECPYHSLCNLCPYGTEDAECIPLKMIEKLN